MDLVLEIEGVRKPITGWGIDTSQDSVRLTLTNQAPDTLAFTCSSDVLFSYGAKLSFWKDGTRIFSGEIDDLSFFETQNGERRKYSASGPWKQLEEITYQQPWNILKDVADLSKGKEEVETSRAVLFLGDDGVSIAAGLQAKAAVDYAIAKGAVLARTATFDLDLGVPWEKALDISCAEVVKRCMRWSRDAVTWFDYSVSPPVLHIGRRRNLVAVSFDLTSVPYLDMSIRPRYDLQPRGVLVNFFKVVEDDAGSQWLSVTNQGAGSTDGGRRCIVITYMLAGVGENAEKAPLNLAANFYDSIKDLTWQGELSFRPISGPNIGVGNTLNILGKDSAWSTMAALVQSVEIDALLGTVRVIFGPAEHLGIQDYYALLSTSSTAPNPGNNGSSRTDGTNPDNPTPPGGGSSGGGGGGTGPGGGLGTGYYEITVCDNGQKKTIKVYGQLT